MASAYQHSWERIQEYLCSPEHQQNCSQYQAECDRLSQIASKLYQQLPELIDYCNKHTARREFAGQSKYMHRGVHCPSPIFDIIVGNAKRGIILKRTTSRSNPTHAYGFDSEGRLLWCNHFINHKIVSTEYLVYKENVIFGITITSKNTVQAITEEVIKNGKLVRYFNGLCSHFSDCSIVCHRAECEEYIYDAEGLSSSIWHRYVQAEPQTIYRRNNFRFTRKDGYLSSYICDEGYTHQISVQRKA